MDSFASTISSLLRNDPNGSGLQELDLKIGPCDIVLGIEVTKDYISVLHLQHVRADTLDEAKAAVNNFIDPIEPLDDSGHPGVTVFRFFNKAYKEMVGPIDTVLAQVEDFDEAIYVIDDSDFTHPKRPGVTTGRGPGQYFNPAEELGRICRDFQKKVREVKEKSKIYRYETSPKRNGLVLTKANDYDVHGRLISYLQEQSEIRSLVFDWDQPEHSGSKYSLPVLHLQVQEGGGLEWNF